MNDEELRSTEFPIIWDNTMKGQVWACPRKFYWFIRGYDYATRPTYFTWGSAWQEILVVWYSNTFLGQSQDELKAREVLSLKAGLDYYDKNVGDAEPNLDNSRDNLKVIFGNYASDYPDEQWAVVPGGAEVGWVWPIKGTDYFLGGALDGYIRWEPYGLLVLENKTTGEYLSDGFIARWDFSPQVTGYVWYLTEMVGTDEVFGALMNLVTKKRPGPRSKWKTPRTARSLVKKSKPDLERFREDSLWIIELAKTYWTNWYWPMTQDPTNCTGGAGKAPCLFKNLCRIDGVPFEKINPLTTQGITTRSGPWEPWNRVGGQDE